MPVMVDFDGAHLEVRSSGTSVLLTLSRRIRVSAQDITQARVASVASVRDELGWRTWGSAFPGLFLGGWFAFRGAPFKSRRQWWAVLRAPEVLVVDTRLNRPARLVIETPRRHEIAAAIQRRVGAADPS